MRDPNKEPYWRVRDARAKAAGYTGLAEERKAKAIAKAEGLADKLTPEAVRERKAAAADRRQIFPTEAGTSVQTTKRGKGYKVLTDQLRGHGSGPARMYVTVNGRRFELDKHGRAADKGVRGGGGILGGAAMLTPQMVADQLNASFQDRYNGETVVPEDIEEVVIELLENWGNFSD